LTSRIRSQDLQATNLQVRQRHEPTERLTVTSPTPATATLTWASCALTQAKPPS